MKIKLVIAALLIMGFIPTPVYAGCVGLTYSKFGSGCSNASNGGAQCPGTQLCCTPDTQCPPSGTKNSDFFTGNSSTFSPQGKCGSATEIDTAIGCIPTDFTGLFNSFFTLGIGIAGGIAFLLILFGGFQILTSAGNPERLAAGKELVTSAITGLLMIIFSVFLLRVIGVDILGIPGFL